jgi:Adenosine deaminase
MTPLADLHRHLEGSIRPATAIELAARAGISKPPAQRLGLPSPRPAAHRARLAALDNIKRNALAARFTNPDVSTRR